MAAPGEPHEESIKVCCRFRPQNQMELDHGGSICMEVQDSTSVYVPSGDHCFVYDRVFGCNANQKEVYDFAARPVISSVLRGFNGTVFAYGQTSSGKTYTMEGPDIEDRLQQGVIPRMVWSIFDGIYHADEHIEFLVKVSIVEIYNERLRDLLDPKRDNLKIHEDKARGVFIGDVGESYVGCEQEIFDYMRAGHFNRSMAVTNMNEHSSRSHMIFVLTVEQKNLHDRSVKVGKLHLVDLAGSEKVAKTGATGERLDEAKNINKSLAALGHVIHTLTDGRATHVPYRDSKLTRVLQESLGGNAKTSLIITCSPSNFNEQETMSTLRFGQRAKMIKNVVKINHERSAEELKLLLEKKDIVIADAKLRIQALELTLRKHDIPVPLQEVGAAAYSEFLTQENHKREETNELYDQIQAYRDQLQTRSAQAVTNGNLGVEGASASSSAGAPAPSASSSGHPSPRSTPSTPADGRALEDRHKDADRPLKKKVSQLDKNLEQLTVMYHKLVAQNSGLKVEVTEVDKKIARKDHRIGQLEKNLREAKQKYEKLLTQYAAAVDCKDRPTKPVEGIASNPVNTMGGIISPSGTARPKNIMRPVRGGTSRVDSAEAATGGYPLNSDSSPAAESPVSVSSRLRDGRTLAQSLLARGL